MPKDFYEVLGVQRDASVDAIRSAYRKLARQYHPDRNPGDKAAAAKFREIQEAYDVLSDKDKKAKYDQFGHAFEHMGNGPSGSGGQGPFTWQWSSGPGQESAHVDPAIFQSLFEQMMGGGGPGFGFEAAKGKSGKGKSRKGTQSPPQDVQQQAFIDFITSINGGNVDVVTPAGQHISLRIPPGIESGKIMRLRGQGFNGGDLLVAVQVQPHAYFRREGYDLIVEVPLTFAEAALGAKVDVPTLEGMVTLTVPEATSSGKRLRIRGKGIVKPDGSRGDQYVEVKVVMPPHWAGKSHALLKELAELNPYHPRANAKW